jgi:hypothetical protein
VAATPRFEDIRDALECGIRHREDAEAIPAESRDTTTVTAAR